MESKKLKTFGVRLVTVGTLATAALIASPARAHEDPADCFETGPAIIVSVLRADGIFGVAGAVSECETINYRARLQKAGNADTVCAFSQGTISVTTPDGVVHSVNMNVPCIGGTALEGCDSTVDFVDSALVPYTVDPSDIVGGVITAVVQYTGGITHDSSGNTSGVGASTPKSTPVVFCIDNDLCTTDVCDPNLPGSTACVNTPVVCNDDNLCTADACNPATGSCTFTPNVVCNDNDACTDDACDPDTGNCEFTPDPTNDPICQNDAICRTPGYWKTHGAVSQQVINLAGGCLEVCGEVITTATASSVGNANSVLEAMCVSPRGEHRLQLVRQLTGFALNCVISDFGPDCGGDAGLGALFAACNDACINDTSDVGDCIAAVDCFANGGLFNPGSGLCGPDPGGSCHARALPDTLVTGSADTPKACNAASKNTCEVILAKEANCTSGIKQAAPESCP